MDCTALGAVCTGDGRKLSNRLEITVSGPASRQSSRQQQQNSPATGSPAISGTAQATDQSTSPQAHGNATEVAVSRMKKMSASARLNVHRL